MNSLKFKFAKILDTIIDRSLECQERLLRNEFHSPESLMQDINTVLEFNHRLYRVVTHSVDEKIRVIETQIIPNLESEIKQRERIMKPKLDVQSNSHLQATPALVGRPPLL